MKKKIFAFLSSLVALALEITPWGAVLRFAHPEGEPIRKTYSYFSLVPYGYANFFPLLTAIVTSLLVIVFIIAFVGKKQKSENTRFYLAFAGAILSLLPLLGGIENFSLTGLGITLFLALSALLLFKNERLQ